MKNVCNQILNIKYTMGQIPYFGKLLESLLVNMEIAMQMFAK